MQKNKLLTTKETTEANFLQDQAEKLNIPLCPTSGTWTIDEKGINCSDHEN